MPPVAADSALGAATLALIAHERGEDGVGLGHPVLEQAFQRRQLERARVVINAAGAILVRDLLVALRETTEWLDGLDAANEVTPVRGGARVAIPEAEGRDPS